MQQTTRTGAHFLFLRHFFCLPPVRRRLCSESREIPAQASGSSKLSTKVLELSACAPYSASIHQAHGVHTNALTWRQTQVHKILQQSSNNYASSHAAHEQ